MRAHRMRSGSVTVLSAMLASAACATAPKYVPPTVPTGDAFKELGPWQPAGTDVPPAGRWWELFGDPVLNGLAERIEAANPALAASLARYAQAAALVGRTRADMAPQVDVSGSAEAARLSAGRPLSPGSAATYRDYVAGATLNWELDLFGRIRGAVSVSEANAQAAQADVAGMRLGLQAQLAATYYELRGLDARIALLRETVEAYERAYGLTQARHKGGIASGIDVGRAQTQLATARAELDGVRAARARSEHAIAVLLGEVPSRFSLAAADLPLTPPRIPEAVPSTLLQRRPDIAAAERRVAAANAQIGVARAALFPRITLGAAAGLQTASGGLFDVANTFWALGPLNAVLSIFDGGARRANVRITRAQYDEAASSYRETVLNAFLEVEDTIVTMRHLADQAQNQLEAATAAERTQQLALVRYRAGASDYLEVVTAQTAALDAERALLDLRSRQLTLATDLVRALGGLYDAAPVP